MTGRQSDGKAIVAFGLAMMWTAGVVGAGLLPAWAAFAVGCGLILAGAALDASQVIRWA